MRILRAIFCLAALTAIVMAAAPRAEAANLVIIAASDAGDRFAPGLVLQSGDRLEIPAGGKLTLISQSGMVINLGGPYSGPADAKALSGGSKAPGGVKGALAKIADLVTNTKKQSTVLGASRKLAPMIPIGDGGQADHWLMVVDSSGHRCVRINKVDMWRKNSGHKSNVSLRSQSAKQTGLIWPVRANRMRLPQSFVRDGTLIVMKIGQEPRRINLHVTPADLDMDRAGAVLNWMIDNKCTRQAEVLVHRLHQGAF